MTQFWRVLRRNVIGKTVELLLEVDENSANLIAAQSSLPNYMFGKARMRRVNRGATNTGNGNSAAKSGKVQGANPSGKASSPPVPSNPVPAGTVPQRTRTGSTHKPPAGHNSGAARTVQPKARQNSTLQPLAKKPQSQKPRNSAGRSTVTSRLQQPESSGTQASKHSATAAGNRLPNIGSVTDSTKDGPSTQQ